MTICYKDLHFRHFRSAYVTDTMILFIKMAIPHAKLLPLLLVHWFFFSKYPNCYSSPSSPNLHEKKVWRRYVLQILKKRADLLRIKLCILLFPNSNVRNLPFLINVGLPYKADSDLHPYPDHEKKGHSKHLEKGDLIPKFNVKVKNLFLINLRVLISYMTMFF